MLSPEYLRPLRILQIIFVTAYLRAFPTVGTSTCEDEAGLAVAAVTYTERPVNKRLKGHCGGGTERAYLLKRKFSGQHELREARIFKETGFFRCADVALGGCMKGYRGDIHAQDAHILHDKGIHTDALSKIMDDNIAAINKDLPAYSQIRKVKIYNEEFEKTPKRSIKRYLYQHAK